MGHDAGLSAREPTDLSHRSDLTLSDFVLALTKTILRPGGYSKDQPEAVRSVEAVHKAFSDLMQNRGSELTFELSEPPSSLGPHDILIDDGLNQQFARQILSQGIAETFAAKLVEYFVSQRLLVLVMKKGMAKKDLEAFLERRGDRERRGPNDVILETAHDLAQHGVHNLLLVPDADRPAELSGRVSWRAELLLARIAREADAIPQVAKLWGEDPVDLARKTFAGVFGKRHVVETLFAAAVHLPEVLPDEPMQKEVDRALLASLQGSLLTGFTQRLTAPSPNANTLELTRTHHLIQKCAALLLHAGTPEALAALVPLQERGLIRETAMDEPQRKLMRAAALAKAASTSMTRFRALLSHDHDARPFARLIEDLELLTLGIGQQRDFRQAAAFARILREYADGVEQGPPDSAALARAALSRLGASNLAQALHRALISPRESGGRAQEFLALFEPAERSAILRQVLRDTPEVSLRQWAIDQLSEVSPKVSGFLSESIATPGVQPGLLRSLFSVARKTRDVSAFDAIERHLSNSKAQLRAEALSTLIELSVERAAPAIERGLEDPTPEVRKIALPAVGQIELAKPRTMDLLLALSQDESEQEATRAQAVLSLAQLAEKEAQADARPSVLERLRETVEDKHGGALRRFKRLASSRKPPTPAILAATCRALGFLGDAEDQKRLRSCLQDDSPEVREAAEAALETIGARLGHGH